MERKKTPEGETKTMNEIFEQYIIDHYEAERNKCLTGKTAAELAEAAALKEEEEDMDFIPIDDGGALTYSAEDLANDERDIAEALKNMVPV